MSSTARKSESNKLIDGGGEEEARPPSPKTGRKKETALPPSGLFTPLKPWLETIRETAGEELWNDWRWQMKSRITTAGELGRILSLSKGESAALKKSLNTLRMAITPYYASLIDRTDPG